MAKTFFIIFSICLPIYLSLKNIICVENIYMFLKHAILYTARRVWDRLLGRRSSAVHSSALSLGHAAQLQ